MKYEDGFLWAKNFNGVDIQTSIPFIFEEFKTQYDAFVIYSGPVGSFISTDAKIIADYIKASLKSHANLLFDNILEGQLDLQLKKIYEILSHLPNINPSRVYYFTSAIDAVHCHKIFCQKYNVKNPIHIYIANFWEHDVLTRSEIPLRPFRISPKSKNFLCFNRMLRPHRLALAAMLDSKSLIENSYYSFFGEGYFGTTLSQMINELKYAISEVKLNKLLPSINALSTKLPLKLTTVDHTENANFIKKADMQLFMNSYFSLVTETHFFPIHIGNLSDLSTVFFSEKIFKPIIMRHPFILVGRPHSLQYLKKLGYKTFAPFINEEYDTEEKDYIRLEKIVSEVERLCKQTKDQWREWELNIKEIVEFNYQVISTRTNYVVERS